MHHHRSASIQTARDIIRDGMTFVYEFLGLLRKFRDLCVICAINGINSPLHYNLGKCKFMLNRCLRCLARDHSVQECVISRTVQYENNGCIQCGLPKRINDQLFHDDDEGKLFGPTCQSLARDRLVPVAWYVYWMKTTILEPSEYNHWLT